MEKNVPVQYFLLKGELKSINCEKTDFQATNKTKKPTFVYQVSFQLKTGKLFT